MAHGAQAVAACAIGFRRSGLGADHRIEPGDIWPSRHRDGAVRRLTPPNAVGVTGVAEDSPTDPLSPPPYVLGSVDEVISRIDLSLHVVQRPAAVRVD